MSKDWIKHQEGNSPKLGMQGPKDWAASLGYDLKEEMQEEAAETEAEQKAFGIEDGAFVREEAVDLASSDLNFLAGLAVPHMFKFLFPPVLLAAWQLLTQCVGKVGDQSKVALGIPRGFGKTTLIKIFILYCILFTKKQFILVICSTSSLAENIIADVIDMLEERNIQSLFGDWKLGVETNRNELKKFGFCGRNIVMAAIGAEGSIRGLNIKNVRPDVILFEDVQTKECSESDVQSESLERWMIGTAMKTKSSFDCLTLFIGNMYPGKNSILKKLKTNKNWIKFISGAILADGTSLWPALRSVPSLIEELDNDMAMGHPEIFLSEVLNDTDVAINNKVDLSKIPYWKWSKDDRPQGKFIIIDPATGKHNSDDCAIGYCEIYDGTPGLRDIIEENLSPGNTIRRALLLALNTNTRVIACEATGYQRTLLYWFNEISSSLGITGIYFVEVHTSSIAKNTRIMEALKGLTAGEMAIHDDTRSKVTAQIAHWNPLKKNNIDGILDVLAYMPKVVEMYGPICASETDPFVIEAQSTRVSEGKWAF